MSLHRILRRDGGESVETTYSFVPLELSHVDALMDLQRIAETTITDPDLLRIKTRELTAACLEPGLSFGAVSEGQLIACVLSNTPEAGGYSSGKYLDFDEKELARVINFEMAITLPSYRGQGLNDAIKKYAIEELRKLPHYEHLVGTISPKNANLLSTLRIGGIIRNMRLLYGGVLRYISYYPLKGTVELIGETIEISFANHDAQAEQFNRSYVGCEIKNTPNDPVMVFRKFRVNPNS